MDDNKLAQLRMDAFHAAQTILSAQFYAPNTLTATGTKIPTTEQIILEAKKIIDFVTLGN